MSAEMRRSSVAAAESRPLRVLILSNQALIRSGLRRLLEDAGGECEVDESDAGVRLRQALDRRCPDVVLIDRDAYDAGQLEAVAEAVHANGPTPILVVSGDSSPETCRNLVRIGVMGCVTKDNPPEVLAKAVEKVSRGEAWFDRSTVARFVTGMKAAVAAEVGPALTSREGEIVECVAAGLKNKQIARRLFISEVTVRHHLTSVYSKLGVANRQHLMLYAFERGLVPPPGRGDT
jgi:DNA-binding NarL/FixJ family response regulator